MLNNFKSLNRIETKKQNISDLFFITKFLKFKNKHNLTVIDRLILSITFENINFNKKRISLFLILIEMLTLQKIQKNLSRKVYVYLNLRKNSFIGCKINLRKKNLENFIDDLVLFLPLLKTRLSTKLLASNNFSFNFVLSQLINLYQMTNIKQNYVNKINLTFIFSS